MSELRYSKSSAEQLESCDPRLQVLFRKVLQDGFDHTIVEGHRNKARQETLFNEGKTQVHYPDSLHNPFPAEAVDVQCYPIDWGDRERQTYFAGHVMATARILGIPLRWGGDWDRDTEVSDNNFDDLCHFELAD